MPKLLPKTEVGVCTCLYICQAECKVVVNILLRVASFGIIIHTNILLWFSIYAIATFLHYKLICQY